MDHQCHLNRDVAIGNGVVLHHGWIYSHSSRDRSDNRVASIDQQPPSSLTGFSGAGAGIF